MPTIHLTTFIKAPVQVVFDLSRNIELHKRSMSKYREEAVAGTRFGLVEKEDTVTWKARHLFRDRFRRIKVTEMQKPVLFTDVQLQGSFKAMKHEHHFKPCDNGTIMIDLFHYESPYGMLGKCLDRLYLYKYLKQLLELRNNTIKEFAESDKWKRLLQK